MSKINSFVLVIIIALSLSSCTDNKKNILNTWRIENVTFSKPIPPQMQSYLQSQIDFMKSFQRTTYNADGSFDDVQGPKTVKGRWDMTKDDKMVYYTDESGKTLRYMIKELSKNKFTYSIVNGPADTLTFFLVPFSAKDTLNKKPLPQQQMAPQAQDNGGADQPQPADDSSAAPASKKGH